MDLLSTIRKSGSRGGVNFSWDDVATSAHRENYLGHSLKAPVGRWQQGRDLNWYAKSDPAAANSDETEEERRARERREEIRKIKEAEEDAISRALGLPITPRNTTGANAVEVAGSRIPPRAEEPAQPPNERPSKDRVSGVERVAIGDEGVRRSRDQDRHQRRRRSRSRDRHRDRSRDRQRRRERSRDGRPRDERARRRSRSRNRERDRHDENPQRHRHDRSRSRGAERPARKQRSRSREQVRRRSPNQRRSRSPPRYRERERRRESP